MKTRHSKSLVAMLAVLLGTLAPTGGGVLAATANEGAPSLHGVRVLSSSAEITLRLPGELREARCYLTTITGGAKGPCDDELVRTAVEIVACLIFQIPLLKAYKITRNVVKALRKGGGFVALTSAIGGFFCYTAWDSFWSWVDCRNAMHMIDDPTAHIWEELADALEKALADAGGA